MVAVKYDELSEAFEFVSVAAPFEHGAYIDRKTGKIYWISEKRHQNHLMPLSNRQSALLERLR